MNDLDKFVGLLKAQLEIIHPWYGERTYPEIKPERLKIGGGHESIKLEPLDISFTFKNGKFIGATNHRITREEQKEFSHYVKELGYKEVLRLLKSGQE